MAKSFKSWAAQNTDDDLRREEKQEEEQTRPKSFKAWKQESTAPATSTPAPAAVPSATPSSSPSSVPAATEQRTGFKAWRQQNGTPVPETPEPQHSTMERYRPNGVYRPEVAEIQPVQESPIESASSIGRYRPGGVYKTGAQEIQTVQPWDALYSSGAIARGKELAAKGTLTREEKQEARAIQREIEKATKTYGAAKSDKYAELTDLNAKLYSKSNWFAGFGAGVIQALGFDWLTDRTADIVEAITGIKSDTGAQELTASAQKNFPVWNAAGNISGSVLELSAISSAVSGALSKASWFAKIPQWVQRATSSAITFGLSGAANGVAEIQSKEEWDKQEQKQAELAADFGAEYTPREYSLGNQLSKVGIGAATGAASGALGGALSSAFGAGTTNILRRYGLQYNTALRAIASGITGMGFAAGSTAAQEVSKYLQYPEGYTPNAAEIGTNLAIAFLFSTASSAINEAKSAQSNKEQMLRLMDELAKEYGTAKIKMAGMVGENRVSEATRVYELSQRIREGLATSPGMSGVQEEVKALAAALDIIDDQMLAIMSGGNGLLGAADVVTESGAPAGVPLSEAIALVGANVPAPNGVPVESAPIPQTAEPTTVPAWYTALMNSPRPMDQPMQQRPTLPTPTQEAPQQESQAPILPTPETATAQATAHTDEAPAPSAPVRSEELTPEPERGIVKEEPKYSTPEGNKLAEGLKAYDKLESNGFEYTLSDTSAGWIGHLRDIRDSRMGGMISNARALNYQTQPMNTRWEAVDALVQVAERNNLLGENPGPVSSPSPEEIARLKAENEALNGRKRPEQTTVPAAQASEAPVLPKEGETDADIAARMGISKPLWDYTRHSSTPLYGIDVSTGKSYMGDKKAIVEVDNTAESVAMQSRRYGGVGATSQDMSNILKYANRTINSPVSNPLTEQPRVLKDENGEEYYIIDVWGGHLGAVGKDQARLIDGYKIIASGEEPNGGGYLVSVNEDGSIHGVTRYAKTSMSYADYKKLPKGKLNGVTKAKQEKGVTNGRGKETATGTTVGKEPQLPGEMEKGQGRLQEPTSGRAGADRQASQGIVQQSNAQRADRVKQAAISPAADTIEREFVDRIKKEYGVNAYVIPADVWEETFGVNAPELRTLRGEVYVKQGIDTDALSVGIPHEATHAMRQTKYQPYLSFLDEIPEYYNFNSPTARRFLDVVLEHIGLDSIDELSTNDYQRLYDELMAAVYGEAINGHTAGNTDYGRLDFNDIFTNFDELFTRLKKIHEDFKAWNKSRLKLPTEETLAPKTEDKAPVITVGQKGESNGSGEVDTGRPSVRGGKPGPGGPAKAGEKPEAGERVSGSGDIRHGDVQPDEGNAEQPGTRSGRSDDTLRPEQGGNAGHAGTADGQAVSGVAGENAGSAEPGLSVGADDGRGRVNKSKPRNRKNYRIAEDIDRIKPNYQDNIDAIKLMKELMETGRKATPEEMAVLAKYKGWGALKEILNEYSYWGRVLSKLVTPEEYNAAKLSTANAHYTSTKVINAMYDAVKRLGFTGGRVLEPSMGVGNFFGVMPDKISRASELYGVELDSITGNIAKLLYPDAKIDVAGFQDVLYADDTFDLVIGNVPFSNEVKIPYRGSTYNLHDFFFVKALDETKPGGIAALITSTGTLDKTETKVRRAIAERANLIAAFRLPDDAFKTNAGTSVTTDLIFLQKKGNGIDDNGIAFETIGKLNDIPINEYYTQHPKNILGNLAYEKGMYPGERAVVHSNGEDMQQALSNAIKTLPKDIMNTSGESARPVIMRKRGERKKATFVVRDDGSVEITDGTTGEVIEYGKATKKEREAAETIRDYVGLKNTFMDLLETEGRGENGTALRERLNTQYDSFVKKHGHLSDPSNKKLLKPDGDYIRTTGIEVKTKDGYGKSDIFRVPTVSKLPKTHADSAEEALSITLNESGKVDISRMAELTGKTRDEIKDELNDEIIQTPDGDWQLVAQYASGNIYEKLDRIGDKPEYDRHRRLLEAALPRRKGADEIDASFGAHWIAPEYVKQFIDSTFFVNAKVQYNKELGQWTVEFKGWPSVQRFNTDRIDAKKIIESTLNGKNVVVKDKIDDKSVINEPETKLAQAKQDDLREAFREWAFKDSKRAEDLIDTFNRSLNAYAPMNYDALANRIDFGVNPASTKQPRDYQKAAAARIVFGGNTLLHNGVGTGKTLTMAIAAHALKQAGIAQKPMFVVPNGKVEDFRSEILEAYPDAKILALDNDSMTPKQIQATKSLIATGDWDYVIIYRSAFELIPLSPERAADALQRQLDLYESAARDIAGDKNGNKRFEKGLAQRVETLRNRIQELLDKPKDSSTYFDDMGIDALFVDEAHNYKKVGFPTSMQVSGIVSDTNDITTDLYMKEEYLRDRGKRIVLASATPITNAISEMYNMTMHVAPEVYRNAGIYSFDAWANTFANIESQVEIAPDGKTFRRKERVRSYKNANELFGLYRQFADIKQTKDVVENLPKAEEITVISESDDLHKQIVDYLSNMPADRILQMNNDNRAAATDLRLVTELLKEMGLDPDTMDLDLPGSKINKAVNNIVQEYKKSKDVRGTQFVFLDIGINSEGKRYHFNLYDDMINKLVNAGIPRSEIAKIGDYNDEESRQILYNKMNNGDIRVLIGSTAKMGEGVNAQQRAVALHDVSVPWRPDNLEQRHGRIVRSGNINKNVRIYRYVQEGSYDSYLWQMIERKAAYLSEAYNGGDATDMDELNDAMVSYRESKAIATGNPLIMEKMSLQDKISRLKILQRGWQKEKLDAQKTIDQYSVWKLGSEGEMKSAKADMETYKTEKAKAGDDLKITIGKKTYDNRKDATDALTPILEKKKVGPIGSLYGFTFGLTYDPQKNEYYLYTQAQGRYINGLGDSPAGNLTRILNLVENAPKNTYEAAKRCVDYYDTGIKDAKTTLEAPFKHQKELEESQARMRVIDAELGVSGNEEEVITESSEGRSGKSNRGGEEVSNMVDSAKKLYTTKHDFSKPMPVDEFRKLIEDENKAENYFPKGLSEKFIKAIAKKATFTRPKLYRGIDASEFDFLVENKFLKSNSSYNFEDQKGQTLSDESAGYALSYATGFAPNEIAKRHYEDGLPTYLIEFVNSPNLNVSKNSVQESYTYDTIDQDYITRIFEITYDPETKKDMIQDVTDSKVIKSALPNIGKGLSGVIHGLPAFYRDKTTGTILYAVQGPDGYETGSYISEKDPSMMFSYEQMNSPAFSKHAPALLGISGNEADLEMVDLYKADTSNFNGNTAPAHPENWKAERVGDRNKTPMSLTDIVNMIRHDFDIPVTTGNIRSPNARAQYRRQPQSVRTKITNSIPDIAHELGHHLDNIYDIQHKISKEAKKEIVDAMPESFKSQYKDNQLPGEGVAEFLRRYLQNSETAAIDYPVFTEEFLGMLDSKGRAAIEKLADEMNAYYSLSEETGNWPIHNREDKGKDYRDFGEKLSDMHSRFRTLFIDSMEPIRQVDKAAGTDVHKFAINSAYAGNRAYAAITGDLYDLRGNYLGDGLQKALKGIRVNNKKEYTDFGWYLTCRHGPERLAEGMRVTGQDAWNNTPFMDEMVKEFEERYPEFRAAADRLYEFIANVNQIAVDAGLYSQDTMDSWMDRWHYYVPLNRWFGNADGKTKGIRRSFANQKGPYKHAYGSGQEIINPVDNVIENTVRIITASIYNDVMQKLTQAVNRAEGLGWLMEQVPAPLARKTWDGAGLKSKTLEAFQEAFKMGGKPLDKAQEDFIQRILDEGIDDVLVQYGRGKAHGNIVTVMKDGSPEYWMVNDPDLLKSIANMETGRGSDLINILGRVNRFITGNITGMNVVWSLASNSPRDLGTLLTLSKSKNVVSLLKGILGSYVNSVKGDKADALFKEYMAMGGGATSAQTADKNMARAARKALQKNAADWLNPLETVEFISDMIERGPRYAEYRICRTKYGMSPEEAFYAAMEVTTNFKRRGLLTGDINKIVPFFNASVQGVDRMARWLAAEDIPQDKRKKGRAGRIVAYIGVSALLAALNIALNTKSKKDKDNLSKLSVFTKNNYFVVPMNNGKYVAIPKPRELAIPISAFERLFETLATQNPHSFDDFWEYVTDNTLPGVVSGVAQGDLNSAIGDLGVFGSIHYLVSNQDFLGRPIVSSSLQNLEAKDQYAANTSKLAYYLGQAFNLSPQQIDFIGNEIFGGFWSWQKALIPVSAESDITLGVKGKWVKDPLYSTDITNRLYNQRDKLEKVKNSNPDNVDAAINYRTVSDMASFYGKYYKLARSEKETPQSRETRSTVLDMILGVENKAGSTERAYKFMVDACRIDGSSALMPAVMDTFVKDDNGKTYNLTSQEYFTLQTRYNSLYYNYIRAAMDKGSMSDAEKVAVLKSAKKLAGIVAKGEMLQTKGATSEDYEKIITLYGDENSDVDEGELTRFLANKSLADVDGSGSVSHAELLSAVSGLRLPTEDEIALTSYANPDLGLKLSVVSPYGVDAGDYQRVLEIAGSNPSQAKAEEAIDAVYGRTTTKNRKEKAAMWQALNKSWKAANNPYDSNVSGKVQSGLVVTAK